MAIVIDLIVAVVTFAITLLAAINLMTTLLKQVPFIRKFTQLGIIKPTRQLTTDYITRFIINTGIIITALVIPATPKYIIAAAFIFTLISLFNKSLKRNLYLDYINLVNESCEIVDKKAWNIFVDIVNNRPDIFFQAVAQPEALLDLKRHTKRTKRKG